MFDKNKFAQIIKNIKETYRSQEEFAKKSEIGRTYLSQYMNMKLDEPPQPKILKKLADSSNGLITYEELMVVCGHIKGNDLDSYLLGMLGLTGQDMIDFENSLKNINLTSNEEMIYRSIIEEMRNNIAHNGQYKLDIMKYVKNENTETQSKIVNALNLYMEYLKKMSEFASIASKKDNIGEDTPEIRAIARDVAKLKPEKKELFKNLLKQMSDEADEASKR